MILLRNASTLPFALHCEESLSAHFTTKFPISTADYTDLVIKDRRNSSLVLHFLIGSELAGERLVIKMLRHNLEWDIVFLLNRMYLYFRILYLLQLLSNMLYC